MTENETLREMLTERGVDWKAFDLFEQTTQWSTYNGAFVYWSRERDGKLLVETTAPTKCSASCTPAQAIAATLGSGTCRLVDNESGPDMHCTVCGRDVDDEYRHFMKRYGYSRCPHCGRRIEVVE